MGTQGLVSSDGPRYTPFGISQVRNGPPIQLDRTRDRRNNGLRALLQCPWCQCVIPLNLEVLAPTTADDLRRMMMPGAGDVHDARSGAPTVGEESEGAVQEEDEEEDASQSVVGVESGSEQPETEAPAQMPTEHPKAIPTSPTVTEPPPGTWFPPPTNLPSPTSGTEAAKHENDPLSDLTRARLGQMPEAEIEAQPMSPVRKKARCRPPPVQAQMGLSKQTNSSAASNRLPDMMNGIPVVPAVKELPVKRKPHATRGPPLPHVHQKPVLRPRGSANVSDGWPIGGFGGPPPPAAKAAAWVGVVPKPPQPPAGRASTDNENETGDNQNERRMDEHEGGRGGRYQKGANQGGKGGTTSYYGFPRLKAKHKSSWKSSGKRR